MNDFSLEFKTILQKRGLHEALGFLNGLVPHRFTGVFRFDGEMLRCECLVDEFNSALRQGRDVPAVGALCMRLEGEGGRIEAPDARTDPRLDDLFANPIRAYCGVLIREPDGRPYGSLCHYDFAPRPLVPGALALLEVAAPLVLGALRPARREALTEERRRA